ncbi:MAG: nicotinate-nucleotide adenylyltransferase [Armatimonadota bacterium]
MQKIGIFGGTFNPPHKGHIKAAEQILEILGLDKVIFVPNRLPPHRLVELNIESSDRFKMVELAVKGNPKLEVSDIELKREGRSYTYDTIAGLKNSYPGDKLYFIAGIEALTEYKWYKLDDILAMLEGFMAITRPGSSKEEFYSNLKNLNLANFEKIKPVDIEALDISSTKVRKMIKNGKSLTSMLPEKVIKYINEKGLYK